MVAVGLARHQMALLLMENYNPDLNITNCDGNTAAMIALMCNEPDLLILVLSSGGNKSVNKANFFGYTPLVWCVEKNLISCARYLILAGALVKNNMDGRTVMELGEDLGHYQIIKIIDEEQRKMCEFFIIE